MKSKLSQHMKELKFKHRLALKKQADVHKAALQKKAAIKHLIAKNNSHINKANVIAAKKKKQAAERKKK